MSGDGTPGAGAAWSDQEYAQARAIGERAAVDLVAACNKSHEAAEAGGATPVVARYGSLLALAWTMAVVSTVLARLEHPEAVPPDAIRFDHFHKRILGDALELLVRDLPWPEAKGGQA